ncbi:MAG: DNA repair protein RecO [Salinispira sp.]
MSRNYRSPGIILQVRSSGEKNRLIYILTPSHGIVRALAYGAASPKSKLRSGTQSSYHGLMLFYTYPAKQFTKLLDMEIQQEFSGLRRETRKLYAAGLISEILLAAHGGNVDDSRAYDLTLEYLTYLDKTEPERILCLTNLTLWRLLEIIGEQPDPGRDIKTLHAIPRNVNVQYSYTEGGFFAQLTDSRHPPIQPPERVFLENEPMRTLGENRRIILPNGADKRLFMFLCSLFEYSIGRRLRTLSAGILP